MSKSEDIYYGDTIRVELESKDFDGQYQDPDSHSIRLYDPAKVQSGTTKTAPTKTSVGHFFQEFDIPASYSGNPGQWRVVWTITKNDKDRTKTVFFDVKDPLEV